jgi:ABC-type sugar transport system substrate-binding protein
MKKMFLLGLIAAMIFGFVSCSKKDAVSSGTQPATGAKTIGIAVYSMKNIAIYPLIQGMIDEVTAHGDRYVLVSAENESNTASIVQSVEELVARDDISGILVDNIHDALLTDVVKKANEKKIPMVFTDIGFVDSSVIVANVLNDNYGCGEQAMQRCADDLGGKGNIIVFMHDANAVMRARTQGVHDVLSKYPNIKVLREDLVTLDIAEANSTMEDLLMTYDNIDAIVALVDNTAIGSVAAMKQQGRKGIKVYAVDGSSAICPLIKNGDVVMSVAQNFTNMGKETVEALYDHFDGKQVAKEILVEAEPITLENVDKWMDFYNNSVYTFAK